MAIALAIACALAPRTARAQCASTTAISCGDTKNGALSTVGEVDCFQFDANAGETVSVTTELTAGSFQPCWTIVGPSGPLSPQTCGHAQRTLPDAGTYTIEVHDNGDNETGAYDVNMVVVSDTASNCAEAITCGTPLPRDISVVAESDTYRFTGVAGETVSITVQETGGGLSGCWTLHDPTGASLGSACGQDEKTLAVDGGYTIRVSDQAEAKTGTYDVDLVVVSDSAQTCATPIACGNTIASALPSVGQSNTYKFAAMAGETVSITAQETGGGLVACWTLYDPAGIPIEAGCGQATKPLAVDGEYSIRVRDSNDTKTGTFDLNLTFVSDTASNCAEPIACGQNLARSLTDVAQSNTYRFTAEAGETVSITAQETSAFITACWELYDPEGISVIGACGQAEKTLAVAGDYTIRVYDNGDAETGTYDIDLVVVSDTASNCAEAITCGDTFARTIATTGESDTFAFDAAAGETVSVTAQETGGFLGACWEIYDPQGISLGGVCGQAEKTLAVAGRYTVRVSDDNDTETGSYDVNLVVTSDTAHNCALPIACGDVLDGSIDLRGQSDTYRVDGAQVAGNVMIDTEHTGGMINACWELYDPTGASLGGVCGASERTLAFAGAYTVRVYDGGDNDTGSYSVTLCTPTSTTTTTVLTGTSTTTSTTLPGGGERLSGATLRLTDRAGKPQKRRLLAVSHDPTLTLGAGAGTVDDPTAEGGTLRVLSAAGDRFDATYILPPSGWRALSKKDASRGWKFTNGDTIKLVVVRRGKLLKVVGKGAGLSQTLGANPDPVGLVLTFGTHPDCLSFGGQTQFAAGKAFTAKNAPAPSVCPGFTP